MKYVANRRDWKMRRRYGISVKEYDARVEQQHGQCAACGCSPRKLVIDHDHQTGRVRALLCANCNWMVGYSHEDADRAFAVGRYLQIHQMNGRQLAVNG